MENQIQQDTKSAHEAKWMRLLFMIILLFCGWIAGWLVGLIAVFQFLSTVIANKQNDDLLKFSKSLNLYITKIIQFVTYQSEERAFPFSPWPVSE